MATATRRPNKANTTGAKLRYLRRIKRMTQQELADKTGLSLVTLSNLETGKNEPSVATLRLLDEALGRQVETVHLDEAG